MNTGQQFLRTASLLVANTNLGQGRDLSQLHFRFRVEQADLETPDTMVVRIYNLNDTTQNEIINQYQTVTLQAGYQGTGMQTIFIGQIKKFTRGKENATDRFLEISAAAADLGYNFGFVNQTLTAGAKQADVVAAAAAAMNATIDPGAVSGLESATFGGIFPRGKVSFGLARLQMRRLADTAGARWFIDPLTNTLKVVPNTGYLDGTVVVLSPDTGLIGVPEATTNGISARCLLNPYLRVGTRVQIAGSQVVATTAPGSTANELAGGIQYPSRTSIEFYASVQSGQGMYRAIVIEHEGDTRGEEWYSNLTCLTVDPSAPQGSSVPAA